MSTALKTASRQVNAKLWRKAALAALSCLFLVLVSAKPAHAIEHHHAVGVGYQLGLTHSKTNGEFRVGSVPITYHGRYGGTWAGVLRATLLVPFRANDGESKFAPGAEYDSMQAYDWAAGASYRFSEMWGWDLDAALGPHMNFVRFRSQQYVEWYTATIGTFVGLNARHPINFDLLGGYPELGLHLDGSFDFIDLAHGGDVNRAGQLQALISIGWTYGDKRNER